jgi:hypothetical protein
MLRRGMICFEGFVVFMMNGQTGGPQQGEIFLKSLSVET